MKDSKDGRIAVRRRLRQWTARSTSQGKEDSAKTAGNMEGLKWPPSWQGQGFLKLPFLWMINQDSTTVNQSTQAKWAPGLETACLHVSTPPPRLQFEAERKSLHISFKCLFLIRNKNFSLFQYSSTAVFTHLRASFSRQKEIQGWPWETWNGH